MNKTSYIRALAATAVALAASYLAHGDTVTLDVSPYGDLNGYGGGEFTALNTNLSTSSYAASALIGGGFETFCMAYNEEFVPGNWGGPNYSFSLGNAVLSNVGAPPEYLTAGTAWLYSQFASGTLAGYDYSTGPSSNRALDAEELQLALWWLQSSPGAPAPNVGDPFVTDVLNAFGGSVSSAMSAANSTDSDGVSIMVLTNTDGSYAQPQLYYNVPDNGTTVALLGIGLVAMFALKRRFGHAKQS
jgi:hypothetical protein